jgi:hypothetical protein
MKLGARTLPASHKAAAQSKIEGHERTLQELKTDLKKADISFGSYGSDRDKLFSSSGSDISVSSTDQRTRLLSADELASAAADNVDRANMTMDENLDIAVSALGTLHEQGETITRHRTKVCIPSSSLAFSSLLLFSSANSLLSSHPQILL